MYFEIDENGKIMICAEEAVRPGMVYMEIPEGFVPEEMGDWKAEGGTLVYAPAPAEPQTPTQEERIAALEEQIEMLLSGVTADE